MSSFPPALAEWLQPGAWGATATLLVVNCLETKASEARLSKRIDELKEESQASEARQAKRTDELRVEMKELRADNRALWEKWTGYWEHSLPPRKLEETPMMDRVP